MEMKLLLCILSVLQVTLGLKWETERRTANVRIRNNRQKPIEGLSLVHKYSNVYLDEHTFKEIQPGATSDEEVTVEYNIGLFTLGRDWWKISWISDNTTTLTYTSPNNFRSTVDWFERTVSEVLAIAGWILGGTKAAKGEAKGRAKSEAKGRAKGRAKDMPTGRDGSKPAASKNPVAGFVSGLGSFILSKSITSAMANYESIQGFKQHIIRESDSDRLTTIILENDGTVTFDSVSRISTTVTTSRRLVKKDLVEFPKERTDKDKDVAKPFIG